MDLETLKKEYEHLIFWGDVSCRLLNKGTRGEVTEEARSCIEKAARGEGYIFGTSNAVLPGTPVVKNINPSVEIYRVVSYTVPEICACEAVSKNRAIKIPSFGKIG